MKVGDLLVEVAERGRGRAQLEGRTIMVQSDDSMITADRQRLEHALGNLLDNALTHGAGEVELVGQRREDAVEMRVRDHGAASPTAIWPIRSFASLRRQHGRGTGLGLAIVEAIAEAHGGSVSLSNDDGAAVTLSLPTDPARPVVAPDSDPSAASSGH